FIPTILTLLRPQNPTFMVTPKGEQLERDFVSPFYTPFFIFYHLILFGFLFGLYKWFAYPDGRGTVLITLWWNTFNFFIITIALYVAYEKRQRRKYHRIPANDEIILYLDNQTLHGRIVDLSLGGMAVKLTTDPPGNIKFEKGEQVKALIRDIENKIFYIEPEIVDYDKNKKILRFKFNWSPDDIEIVGKVVEIIFSPSARWQLILDIEREISPFEGFTLLAKNILKDFAKVYILIFNNFKKDFPNFIINIFKNTMEILWRRIKWVY
ncbi:MAG TPA: cellulose synthase catalytic subunit (UDP-forming), partial [Bacteroidia bacterium]|nr:cellulose synthase catalytic subunit (UDP-forming) [Bacteroidia bacterium]